MEIEIRARIKNRDIIEQKLINLGAIFVKEKKQEDFYFSEMQLCEKLGYSFLIRIRTEEKKIFLTYKGAKSKKDGVWEEYEFEIKDKNLGVKMLEAMGLEEVIRISKKRREYELNTFSICLDSIRDLGDFVEIESVSDDVNIQQELYSLMKKLGIGKKQVIRKGYITLLLAQCHSPYAKYIVN